MPRRTPIACLLALLLSLPSPLLARPAPPGPSARRVDRTVRTASGLSPREVAQIVKAVDGDADLVDEMLSSDRDFKTLADRYLPASRSRLAGGRALIAIGVICMIGGALAGAPLYVARSDLRTEAIGVMAGLIGGGFALFVPGVAVAATPSGAETDLKRFWQEHRAAFLRPEASTGPRLRLAAGRQEPRTIAVPLLAVPF